MVFILIIAYIVDSNNFLEYSILLIVSSIFSDIIEIKNKE